MGSADGWRKAAEASLAALGDIDILVNNAGVSAAQGMGKVTPEGLDETLNVNVRNLILLTDAVGLADQAQGERGEHLLCLGILGGPGQIAYSTSKGAVNSYTRNASIDFGAPGFA